jgi:hypothetical protein
MTSNLNTLPSESTEEYPGEFNPQIALREILIANDAQRRRMQNSVNAINAILDSTSLPMHLWNHDLVNSYRRLLRLNTDAQRNFLHALKPLEAHRAQAKAAKAAKPPEPPPKPDLSYQGPAIFYQTCNISIVDGKTKTEVPDHSAAHFLKVGRYHKPAHYLRQLCFEDNCMPEEYAYAFTHRGETLGPARAVFITYTEEEFFRLCQLEIDTNSAHLLDGERVSLSRIE